MNNQQTTDAVFCALIDPDADFIETAAELGLDLTQLLEIAESPPIIAAIEALERLAALRERAILARAARTALAALERIADSDPQTPAATETVRKAAAQILRTIPTAAPQIPPDTTPQADPPADPQADPSRLPDRTPEPTPAPAPHARPDTPGEDQRRNGRSAPSQCDGPPRPPRNPSDSGPRV